MAKRAFIIHGWEQSPDHGWIPWLKKELEGKGFEVFAPAMPDTNFPKMSEWVGHLAKIVRDPDKDCYFVGHSLGCITILRYLESLGETQKVGGAVLVAGFTSHLGFEELANFFPNMVDFEKIKPHCERFVAIHSDNDPWVSVHYGKELFKEKLGAEVIVRHNMGHFSGSDGITELPDVLESVLKVSE
jgi:predicted alpha/beta hydrolase family esterase